jgi:hypothetical protein
MMCAAIYKYIMVNFYVKNIAQTQAHQKKISAYAKWKRKILNVQASII